MKYLYYFLLALISYFIGNISGGRIISRVKHGDITKTASGNPGTLNAWRTFGFWPGITTFLIDFSKGLVIALIAKFAFNFGGCSGSIAVYVAGFSVVLGHIFPIIYKLHGGKGIATSAGVFFVLNWWATLIAFVVMIIFMLFIKYASIFTIGFAIVMTGIEMFCINPSEWVNFIFLSLILLLILYAHRSNINRLLHGKENKTELLKMVKNLGKNHKNSENNEKKVDKRQKNDKSVKNKRILEKQDGQE